jgi:phosphate transport system protein
MSSGAGQVGAGLRVIRVAKYLERIADHATNVAEEVIFMVRGEDVRHGQWQRSSGAAGSEAARPPLTAE